MLARNTIVVFISVAALAARCWKINAPFTDPWSWRQSDVAAIARNYLENGFHFARPQIDWAGDQAGFVGTEFPILPFTAAIVYRFLGAQEWIGRLQAILAFVLSLPFLFGIVRRAFDETVARYALVFYSFAPLSVATGRVFLPDMPALSLALAGFYFFWRGLAGLHDGRTHDSAASDQTSARGDGSAGGGNYNLLIASIVTGLALLIKPPMATIAAPMAAVAWRKFGIEMFRRPLLWLVAVIALLPSVFWYWHAYWIAQNFYPYHFFGAGGVRIMGLSWYGHIVFQTVTSTLTPILFAIAVLGLFVSRDNPCAGPFRWWLIAMIAFVIVVGYGNRHQWYQLPLVPIAAAYGGAALKFVEKKWTQGAAIGLVTIFLAFSFFCGRQFFTPAAQALWRLGRELRDRTPVSALVIAADDGDPTAFYYAHRKGWHFLEKNGVYDGNPARSAQIISNLERLRGRGATHLVFYSGTLWWLDYYTDFADYLARNASLESAKADYRIYKLAP
jgi:4-amino-4-deoxy-L-arabinose transferase-like glycosyltransferase